MTNLSEQIKNPTLRLHCPKCRSVGLIPWDKLDRTVICGGCGTWYRVESTQLREMPPPTADRYRVQVRTHSSAWQEDRVVLARPRAFGRAILEGLLDFVSQGKARWMVAASSLVLVIVFIYGADRGDVRPVAVTVPTELEDRAACLVESVAKRDTERLFMLTDPNFHRALRIWLANNKDLPERIADDTPLHGAVLKVEPKVEASAGQRLDTVNIQSRLALPEGKSFALNQRWVKLVGGWAFQPPMLRSYVQRPSTSRR